MLRYYVFFVQFWLKDPEITEVFFKSQRYRDSMIFAHFHCVVCKSKLGEVSRVNSDCGGKMLCLKGDLSIIANS